MSLDRWTRASIAWRRWYCAHTSWSTRRRLRNLVSRKAWRYRVAWQMNRLPSTCWSTLVDQVEFGSLSLRECQRDWACRSDVARLGSCYCGKVEMRDGVEVVVR